ncbi:SDR family oxidoreductase [Chitinophaga sedimenti]|uniref:SDR family NAD(P)-dependent oxidoreductase n=1 Tax=Chitinophaga sedimenti TaxID=2033606 RepID=UPI00200519AB|nr:SDR family oxidoreductase [Chitinophaga sedimenti]MCK7554041.1 SDR family oxidoreductase [Chitinophaga sedimenti]
MMTLSNKNAVVYGAAGSLGQATSLALAAAGVKVFLTGQHLAPLQEVAQLIRSRGGQAEVAQVDALDQAAIEAHLQTMPAVDISFNAIGWKDQQDQLLVDMSLEDFYRPVDISIRTNFLTGTAAARRMIQQGGGVILTLTATPGGVAYPQVGGFGPACCVVESFTKNLASEVGVHGVRVVNIRSGGSPDSRVFRDAAKADPEGMAQAMGRLEGDTMLKQLPLMQDIANAAVFLASELAGKITGTTIDLTCGSTTGLNHSLVKPKFVDRA